MPKSIKHRKQKRMSEKECPERKSIFYSQNFLKKPELVRHLLEKSSIGPKDIVYEVGPGRGIITEQLAFRCKKVIAIEKDQDLLLKLKHRFDQNPKIEIHQGDFLEYRLPQTEYKVFSNIPFNITADIIRKLINTENSPEDTYLIVQEEAAKKFTGFPYAGKETLSALLIKPWFEPKVIHNFNREDFQPSPGVDTVLLRLQKQKEPLVDTKNNQFYKDFLAYTFSQWQPTLKEALRKIFTREQFKRLAKDLNFSQSATPTEIKFDQWFGLFKHFLVGVTNHKKQLIIGAEKNLQKQQAKLEKIHRTKTQADWKNTRYAFQVS